MALSLADHLIVYHGDAGQAVLLLPAPDCGLTIEEIAAKDVPPSREHRIISRAQLPTHFAFIAAWRYGDDDDLPIVVDMAAAREIFRDAIRNARARVLQQLDVQFVRALETGGDTAAITAAKQALRDAPADPAIESARDTAELIAQWNSALLGPSPYLA